MAKNKIKKSQVKEKLENICNQYHKGLIAILQKEVQSKTKYKLEQFTEIKTKEP